MGLWVVLEIRVSRAGKLGSWEGTVPEYPRNRVGEPMVLYAFSKDHVQSNLPSTRGDLWNPSQTTVGSLSSLMAQTRKMTTEVWGAVRGPLPGHPDWLGINLEKRHFQVGDPTVDALDLISICHTATTASCVPVLGTRYVQPTS